MFRGKPHLKGRTFFSLLLATTLSLPALSTPEDPYQKELKAKKLLAEKLKKVSKSYSVKEARYEKDPNFDRNTGNPSDSNSTYHSYVWDFCLQLAGGSNCQKWLDPYVSQHGLEKGNDTQSPLESKMAQMWQQMKKEGDSGQGGQYAIWNVQSKNGGSILDTEGRLDRTQLKKFELKKEVREQAEQIGYETASRAISVSFDEDAAKNTMPTMEALRLKAGRYTRIMRNELARNVGELGAASKEIGFALGEDMANCEDYLEALKQVPDEIERDRIKFQGRLDPEATALGVKQRYEACVKMRNASVYSVNSKVVNGKVVQGNPNDEQIDRWRSRVNIAAIDYGGIDLDTLPKPQDQTLTEKEKKSDIAEWKDGGLEMNVAQVSNAEQIESYNSQIKAAAQAMKEVVARSPFIPDASEAIATNQIKPGTVSLVELNGLTKEMKNELKDTDAPSVKPVQRTQNPNPDRNYEEAPSQLSVTAAR